MPFAQIEIKLLAGSYIRSPIFTPMDEWLTKHDMKYRYKGTSTLDGGPKITFHYLAELHSVDDMTALVIQFPECKVHLLK